ncbi:unnamed protein product [Macrosiphum euphorbiae]|uniref:Uncharacterized protein n=1 Tax=Macrosiphum euphorbiae TaxID=13131 RepID=A0AAV0WVH3_9HEMI|nr:unnamed protein product [Macrosiphum euphorbiae]
MWAVNLDELMNHSLMQIALYRGLVVHPPARHTEPRHTSRRPQVPSPARTRTVRTMADLNQGPMVADFINLDTDEEEFLQLRVGPQVLPEVEMMSNLPGSDDNGL